MILFIINKLFLGVVHDAMACASFLKFHPTLPKQGALVITRHGSSDPPVDKRCHELTKEEKARQRHSVEVTPAAGNILNIQPSTLESLTRSAANASANRSRARKITENTIKEGITTEKFPPETNLCHTVSVLPPALKCLVFLWEELSSNCMDFITQNATIGSPINKACKDQENIKLGKDKNTVGNDKELKKSRKKKMQKSYLGGTY